MRQAHTVGEADSIVHEPRALDIEPLRIKGVALAEQEIAVDELGTGVNAVDPPRWT